ncbi:MAG: cryptochrome/photolyase family protein, partial [Chloroflexota bacterium]
MNVAIWITGDQLLYNHPVIESGIKTHGKENLRIVLVESQKRLFLRPFQRKRAVLVLSGMRHYVEDLKSRGFQAELVQADSFLEGLISFCKTHRCSELQLMRSAEYQMRRYQENRLEKDLGFTVTLFDNVQFLVGRFNPYPDPKEGKRYVMENFYREMRKHYDVLMTPEGDPKGGAWNYDKENRKKLPKKLQPPEDIFFEPDAITQQVIEEVDQYPNGIGTAAGFGYAVTRKDALQASDYFFNIRMTLFGPY